MIKNSLFVIVCLLFQILNAQEVKFGKVSIEELKEESYEKDKSANAVVLYKNQITYFNITSSGAELVTEIHERIKIYNKDGFDYATTSIDLFKTGNDKEYVGKIKATTYNLENNKIVETDLDKDQVFQNEIRYNYNQVKFTMPNIKEGSVIEYKYRITSPFIWNIDEFIFQYDIPIKKIVAEIRTPEGFNFKATQKGYINFFPRKGNSYGDNISSIYSLTHVPALKSESYVDNIDNYRAGVMFELISIIIPGVIHQEYATSWADVAKTIGRSDDYENKLDKTNSFSDELDGLLENHVSQIDKMNVIFQYVKDNITWNQMDGKYFYNGIKKALKEQKGNAADINLTLVAMLRYAGINANPVIISTKENTIPLFPTVDRLNYVIAYAVINEEKYFLDATEEFSDINILPIKDYNWQGILVDNTNTTWKMIMIKDPEASVTQSILKATINEDGAIKGKLSSKYTNHNAYKFREAFNNNDAFLASREDKFQNIEISNYNAENTDTHKGYVTESFDFQKDNGADIVNDKIYLQPISFLKEIENPFKLEDRKFPIDFGHPMQYKYLINIQIPEGYILESKPDPILLKIPDNLGEFKFIPNYVGNNITLSVSFEIKKAIVSPNYYLFLKNFFHQIIAKEAEQVVLTKV